MNFKLFDYYLNFFNPLFDHFHLIVNILIRFIILLLVLVFFIFFYYVRKSKKYELISLFLLK
jgi:hypothetical protein